MNTEHRTDDLVLDYAWSLLGPQQNRTKCPFGRFKNLYETTANVIKERIVGDFVEVGTWKGGMCALMGLMVRLDGTHRKVWAFDSFAGMSPRDQYRDPEEANPLHDFDLNDFLETCFAIMKLDPQIMKICPGWIEDSVKTYGAKVGAISILRVDVDYYGPTKTVLEAFYHKVTPGGYIICDDYGYFTGARTAIDEFRQRHGITSPMVQSVRNIDLKIGTEHYWRV